MSGNLLYAQSGGVTSVINQSALGVIQTASRNSNIKRVFAARGGISGVLHEQLIDCSKIDLQHLGRSPGGYFGSCRFKLPNPEDVSYEYVMQRIFEVFAAHDIHYFLYNGGGDSQDTLNKIHQYAMDQEYPLCCIGIPKTIDNDLPFTDCSPGFGSAAKYLATSCAEAACDLQGMHKDSTKLFVLEVMGRNTGWLAAATSLAGDVHPNFEPGVILIPESPLDMELIHKRCEIQLTEKGYCLLVVAEGLTDNSLKPLTRPHDTDAFGHPQLGGIAPRITQELKRRLNVKSHWGAPAYLQRAAHHCASLTDIHHARAVGEKAVDLAALGHSGLMVCIQRESDTPYEWTLATAPLSNIANQEKHLPKPFFDSTNLQITEEAKRYLRPLIQGEPRDYFAQNGLPDIGFCEHAVEPARLKSYQDSAVN